MVLCRPYHLRLPHMWRPVRKERGGAYYETPLFRMLTPFRWALLARALARRTFCIVYTGKPADRAAPQRPDPPAAQRVAPGRRCARAAAVATPAVAVMRLRHRPAVVVAVAVARQLIIHRRRRSRCGSLDAMLPVVVAHASTIDEAFDDWMFLTEQATPLLARDQATMEQVMLHLLQRIGASDAPEPRAGSTSEIPSLDCEVRGGVSVGAPTRR